MRPVVNRRNGITKGKPGGGMMKLIWLLQKKDGVGKHLQVSGDTGARLVADLANEMVRNGVIPSEWEDSFIINIYKGKGDALERGNYRGLKLLDHVMKGIERESDRKNHQGKNLYR